MGSNPTLSASHSKSGIYRRRRNATTSAQRLLDRRVEHYFESDLGGLSSSDVPTRKRMLAWKRGRQGTLPVLEIARLVDGEGEGRILKRAWTP